MNMTLISQPLTENIQVVYTYVKLVSKAMDVNEHETIQHYTQTQIKVEEQLVVRKDMDINEHERLSNITLRNKVKGQPVVRKDMDVNEHERLSNITIRNKLKQNNSLH